MPKGVMLSHENIVAAVSATLLQLAEHKPHKVNGHLHFILQKQLFLLMVLDTVINYLFYANAY